MNINEKTPWVPIKLDRDFIFTFIKHYTVTDFILFSNRKKKIDL